MKKITILFYFSLLLTTTLANAQTAQLLGMTPGGGAYNGGVIFKINVGGTGFDTVYSFNPLTGGYAPYGDLFKASNGLLYGTNYSGGPHLYGSLFSFNPTTYAYTDVHYFDTTSGIQPNGDLIQLSNGKLYGMASGSGANGYGVIFSLNPNSNNTYADLYDFNGTAGSYPYGNLVLASNGLLYGMTQFGGAHTYGTIFSFDTATNTLTDLHDFDSLDGQWPYGSLILEGDKLYGLTWGGGGFGAGVLFSYNIAGKIYDQLYNFNVGSGSGPEGNLTLIPNGHIFYGTTNAGGLNGDGVIFSFDTLTNTYTDLFDFSGANGQAPPSSLVLASDGNFYGMTFTGGLNSDGIIFSFNPTDSDCLDIHDFNGNLGSEPNGNLIELNTTGINQLPSNDEQLLIYPNPASNQLTIISNQLSIGTVRVTNIVGQVVYSFTLPAANKYSKQIDVSTLPAGLYFVSVISGNEITTGKIVVK